ncbi:bacteriocin immunity protein (plasmid) [Clostridium estertheticum]|uniref:bacteriocin immunity protein n=1 Tax=Clostridium estertheticum TaxID=238834 RepID=UPI001C7E1820|nr:bacteriocin immunity protein [Clostridium estertheticum]MBX4262183.1 bacteriocin immunity protein [Clostridium estertheticum]WLC73175.1 bacteriocin immunity protein [Clostridium estertheticum]
MKYSKQSIKAIEAIGNTLKKLDINHDKQLVDLLNEYNNKLHAGDNYRPLVGNLAQKISFYILKNNLKVPNEVRELIVTLRSLQSKCNLLSYIFS